jgi:hypothetical protein
MFGDKTIEVTIDRNGNTKVEAKGYEGGECVKATKSVEEALGKMKKRTLKPEHSKISNVAEKTKIGQ